MTDFITPPGHINFLAKKLFEDCGEIIDGSIAYLSADGGGPAQLHTHAHNHLFCVINGKIRIKFEGREIVVAQNESYLLDGLEPHSVWNDLPTTTVVLGISVKAKTE